MYVAPPELPLTFNVTGITVCAPPLPGTMVIDPVCWVVMLVALANTLMVTVLLELTCELLADTESQEAPLVGVVEKLKGIGAVLAVDSVTEVATDWPVNVLSVNGLGSAEMTLLPPWPGV